MRGFLVFLLIVVVLVAGAAAGMWFAPEFQPEFVKPWFRTATGFTPAQSPDEALDKFKRALQARDYETAAQYCSGEYKDVLVKNHEDARKLGSAIDDLRSAMKKSDVKSDKAEFVLFLLDPFPAVFTIENVKPSGDKATAQLDWKEELKTFGVQPLPTWNVNNFIYNSLLPHVAFLGPLKVSLEKGSDGSWTIQIPMSEKDRYLNDTTAYLRKNGSNFKNALTALKDEVKNSPPTKENFENNLKSKLEESK